MTTHANGENMLAFSTLRKYLPELGLASVVLNVLALVIPITLTQVYDRVIPHQSGATLGMLAAGVFLVLALEAGVKMGRSYVVGWVGAAFDYKLSCAAFRRLLDTPVGEYERDGSGVHMERLQATAHVREFYSGQALLALFDLPFAILYLSIIAVLGGWLVVAPLTLLAIFMAVTLAHGYRLRNDIRRRVEIEERRFSFLGEALAGIHSVKALAMEAIMQRRYERLQEANALRSMEGSQNSLTALNLGALFSQITTVVVVAAGTYAVIGGRMTPGALAACILLAGRSLQPVQSALAMWVRFQSFLMARSQIEKVFELTPAANAGGPKLACTRGDVRLEGVCFTFSGESAPIFTDLSLSAAPGECIAIVGDSGTGKSALLGLVNGALVPTAGRVLIDGADIHGCDPSSIARQIGYLPQQGILFNGTVLENITMFDEDLEPQAMHISQRLGLDRAVATMRNGYDTRVGVGTAESLPSGVKQRIAIARALAHDPRIILFDEANIAIDSAGDEFLRAHLQSLKGSRTMILVTHRPSLLKLADRVLTLRNGRLVPEGAPATEPARAAGGGQIATLERPAADDHLTTRLSVWFKDRSDLTMCLGMLLTALKWHGNMRQLAESLPHMSDGLDLSGLHRVLANLNFTCTTARARLDEIDPRLLPCLFLPDDGDAQVLLGVEPATGHLSAFDGGSLQTTLVVPDRTAGTINVFRPAEPAPQAPGESWIGKVFGRFRSLVWLVMALTLVINILTLAAPFFIMGVYNSVIPSGDTGLMPYLLLGLGIALTLDFGLRQLRSKILSFIGARGEFIVGSAIFERLLGLPVFLTEPLPIGSQLSRLRDFENLRELFIGPLALIFYELPGTIVFVVVLGILNPWLLVVLLSAFALYGILAVATRPGLAQRSAAASRAVGQRQEILTDALSKMRAIKYTGAEDRWFERFRLLTGRAAAAEFASQQYSARLVATAQFFGMMTGLASLVTCVVAAFSGAIGTGAVVASMIITWRLVAPMQNGFVSLTTLFRVVGSIRQIDNLIRMRPERDHAAVRTAETVSKGDIAFARVSFRYSNEADPALLGVSFHIEPGRVAAIAGPNGSGKSTILKLITGIYQPQAGSVRLDNIDIRQIDPGDIRARISYMPQRCDIFYGTIAQNLRLVQPTASDEELRWATEMAGLTDDIERLPKGFDTRLLDGKGEHLPHGFRQRLSLARAYLRKAPVMLFDEPGNGLDHEGDLAFQRAIDRLRGQTTIVMVSHRPSHLKLADTVIHMEEGYVRAVGTYDQVSNLIFGSTR